MTITAHDSRSRFFAESPRSPLDAPVHLGNLVLANPVMPASGCFGPELAKLVPVKELGAVVTKTVFAEPRGGNAVHRITEVAAGVVNSVGIPSLGTEGYLRHQHPAYRSLGVPVIVSVGGLHLSEYFEVIGRIGDLADAFELNVSCPNLENDGHDIGADPVATRQVVAGARRQTNRPIIVKLPAMVSSIADVARAAEEAGADGVCIANSVPVLVLERPSRRPALGNVIGGLTGPSIRPLVSRLVWQAARAVNIPVVACGGVSTADDVLDYLSLGASAVQIGTANFQRPHVMVEIVRELAKRCAESNASLNHLWETS